MSRGRREGEGGQQKDEKEGELGDRDRKALFRDTVTSKTALLTRPEDDSNLWRMDIPHLVQMSKIQLIIKGEHAVQGGTDYISSIEAKIKRIVASLLVGVDGFRSRQDGRVGHILPLLFHHQVALDHHLMARRRVGSGSLVLDI